MNRDVFEMMSEQFLRGKELPHETVQRVRKTDSAYADALRRLYVETLEEVTNACRASE